MSTPGLSSEDTGSTESTTTSSDDDTDRTDRNEIDSELPEEYDDDLLSGGMSKAELDAKRRGLKRDAEEDEFVT